MAPSDTRRRPDQRLMEDGRWDEANDEKLRLEEKQRAARRQRELESEMAVQEGKFSFCFFYTDLCFRSCHVQSFVAKVDLYPPTTPFGSGRRRILGLETLCTFTPATIGNQNANRTGPDARTYFNDYKDKNNRQQMLIARWWVGGIPVSNPNRIMLTH